LGTFPSAGAARRDDPDRIPAYRIDDGENVAIDLADGFDPGFTIVNPRILGFDPVRREDAACVGKIKASLLVGCFALG